MHAFVFRTKVDVVAEAVHVCAAKVVLIRCGVIIIAEILLVGDTEATVETKEGEATKVPEIVEAEVILV